MTIVQTLLPGLWYCLLEFVHSFGIVSRVGTGEACYIHHYACSTEVTYIFEILKQLLQNLKKINDLTLQKMVFAFTCFSLDIIHTMNPRRMRSYSTPVITLVIG